MPRSVHITVPPLSYEAMVKLLRIPKTRQKQLRAMMDEARARLAAEKLNSTSVTSAQEEKLDNASAAS